VYQPRAITWNGSAWVIQGSLTLTYVAGANGGIAGTLYQTVPFGGSGSAVTAVPATNYVFLKWSDNSTQNPRTDTNVQLPVNVTAEFAHV
jgi:hypothetical protein